MNFFSMGKKIKPQLLVSIFIIVIAVLVFLLIIIKPEGEVLIEDAQVAGENNKPSSSFLDDQESLALLYERETFLANNLSNLSAEKEVLGGTFFLTNVFWQDINTAIIEYEDGHIALKAKVIFASGSIVDTFEIIPEEITSEIID